MRILLFFTQSINPFVTRGFALFEKKFTSFRTTSRASVMIVLRVGSAQNQPIFIKILRSFQRYLRDVLKMLSSGDMAG